MEGNNNHKMKDLYNENNKKNLRKNLNKTLEDEKTSYVHALGKLIFIGKLAILIKSNLQIQCKMPNFSQNYKSNPKIHTKAQKIPNIQSSPVKKENCGLGI